MSTVIVAGSTQASRRALEKGSRSFHFASKFLPADARDDAAVLYAFCRLVDDLVDERTDDRSALIELAAVEAELSGGRPPRPEVGALLEMARRTGTDLGAASELIAGMRSDVGIVRIRDEGELLRYSYRAAGTVGLMMCGVLGVRSEDAQPFAVDLGIAMQLTNIARDVAEDARRGRVYLPAERLVAAGTSSEALVDGNADLIAVTRVTRELLDLADLFYDSADEGLRHIPIRPRLAILVASRVYRQIGRRLLRRGGNPLLGRTVVPRTEKIRTAIKAVFEMLRPTLNAIAAPKVHAAALHRPLAGLPGADRAVGNRPARLLTKVTPAHEEAA